MKAKAKFAFCLVLDLCWLMRNRGKKGLAEEVDRLVNGEGENL